MKYEHSSSVYTIERSNYFCLYLKVKIGSMMNRMAAEVAEELYCVLNQTEKLWYVILNDVSVLNDKI